MIIGNKVSLRKMKKEDTENIILWRNNNNVRKYFFIKEDLTMEQHYWWIENKINTGKVVQFIIVDNENKKDIGSVFLRDIDKENNKAEYGIFIGDDNSRGKGLGTEAAELICRYGFEELELHRIFLRVFANNIQAIGSYKKAGFKQEAVLKDDVLIDGNYCDVIIMTKFN